MPVKTEKSCKAGCGKSFLGYPASKFCSPECKKKGEAKPKFTPEYSIIREEQLYQPVLTAPIAKTGYEENLMENKRAILSLPTDKLPVSFRKPGSTDIIKEVKHALLKSITLDQIISNIATKHKYKKPESYVAHIENMLILYSNE